MSDNGSADGSREFIAQRYGGRVQIVENGANLGFAAACNRAFAATSSEYVFLLNPDAELKDRALAEIVAFMDAHPRAGSPARASTTTTAACKSRSASSTRGPARFCAAARGASCRCCGGSRTARALRGFDHDKPQRVDLAIGAALAIRRAIIDAIGPFDERFFLYHEEVDFAKRAADAGWETWYVPASEAVHEGMGSARGQYNVEKRKQTSRRKYWLKHHGRAWYYSLVGALVGRYALYAGVAVGAVVLGRRLLR